MVEDKRDFMKTTYGEKIYPMGNSIVNRIKWATGKGLPLASQKMPDGTFYRFPWLDAATAFSVADVLRKVGGDFGYGHDTYVVTGFQEHETLGTQVMFQCGYWSKKESTWKMIWDKPEVIFNPRDYVIVGKDMKF